MKKIIIVIGVLVGILGMLIAFSSKSQDYKGGKPIRLNALTCSLSLRSN